MISPLLDEIARENEDRFRIAKVNIDDEPALRERFNVRAVPTLFFFQGGELKDQLVGGAPKQAILEKLNQLVPAGQTH
jgi:thioredoxin 1